MRKALAKGKGSRRPAGDDGLCTSAHFACFVPFWLEVRFGAFSHMIPISTLFPLLSEFATLFDFFALFAHFSVFPAAVLAFAHFSHIFCTFLHDFGAFLPLCSADETVSFQKKSFLRPPQMRATASFVQFDFVLCCNALRLLMSLECCWCRILPWWVFFCSAWKFPALFWVLELMHQL